MPIEGSDSDAPTHDATISTVSKCERRLDRRAFLGTVGTAVGATAGLATSVAATGAVSADRQSVPALTRPRLVGKTGEPALPSLRVIALNRIAFGPRPGDLNAFTALADNNDDRLTAFVDQQLNPGAISDTDFLNRVGAAGYQSLNPGLSLDDYLARLWSWYVNDSAPPGNSTSSSRPRDEAIRLKFLRAVYSRRQLLEVIVDFWHDHFNVYIDGSTEIRATFPHFDSVLRAHAFGNFRQMLGAVARSPAMLYYLDNYTSSNAGPNENFCRELIELMTLGADAYLGIMPQNEVPTDGDGKPVGYVDADVFEATRAFTGWSFSHGRDGDGDTGLFYYRASWHDRFQKNVLGVFLPQDQADLKDGNDVLDALASHPATGRHVARKLCRRLIADDPPQSIVDAAAALFTAQWQAPDQLRQVIRLILLSDEFTSTWGEKVKRPFEIAASALRASNAQISFAVDDSTTNSFLWRFDDTGHEPFHWFTPDGFPDVREAWTSMSPRVMAWRLCGYLIDLERSENQFVIDAVGQVPGHLRTSNELVDFWIGRILGRAMAPADRAQMVQFMSQGINPDLDLDLTDESTASRMRALVGLFFMSPDFLWR